MKLLVFLHGTTIMHRNAVGCLREERVRQVQEHEQSVRDFASYVPVGNAVGKLRKWSQQGAEIIYLSSHRKVEHVQQDREALQRSRFPEGQIVWRQPGESYADVAERMLPDVLIEDDCESIGGVKEIVYPHLRPEVQMSIASMVVKEFEGIDHLPDELTALKNFETK
jgi:hypothetical protein